jgi:VCBS repeat-containing protein
MLTGTAPNLTYTPATGYVGADSFTFTATNPGGSSTGTVSITVNPAPPVAQAQSAAVAFNSPASILLTATGGGALTYSLVAMPTHGAVVLSGAAATYTPTTGYAGADSFSFKANNGSDSSVAVVSLTVNPAVPVAANQAVTVSYNTPQTITLSAAGTGTLSYALVAQPANGMLSGTGASLTYTPKTNFAGADSFTFTATNSGGVSNIATVSITVVGAFTWTAASGDSTSATVNAGQTATYNLLVTGWTGSSGTVAFSCAGVPMACTASPNPATLNGTTAVPVTVSVVTTSPAATSGFAWSAHSGSSRWWLLLFSMAWLAVIVPLARRRKLKLHLACTLAALMIVGGISGCGSVPQQPFTTPTGNYTLTVTATAAAVSTSQTLTLTVK